MMKWLIRTSLHMRVLVIALAAALLAMGWQAVKKTPLDVFPEFAPPLVEIQTEAPGLSTEEVENLITVPLENGLNGTSFVKTIRSKTVLGLSSVVLIFQEGTDRIKAHQLVQERVAHVAPHLPAVAKAPVILPPLSSTSRALKVGVWSDTLSQMELTDVALWKIRPRLMAVPGVANVAIWGQRDTQFQVTVDPNRLRAQGVGVDEVVKATADATALSAGGFVDTPNQRLPVTHAPVVDEPSDLEEVVVRSSANGVPVRIADVATVGTGFPPPIGDAIINDQPGLLLIVEKQPWGNTLDVTRNVEAALDALRPGLAGLEIDSTIFRPATFIEDSLANLSHALTLGCLLVAVIIIFFLFEWRTAVISLLAIPLSLLAAALVLYWRGGTMNTMVIAGLVIAVGEVVDDAIIDVENITRRLRLNRLAGNPRSAFRVILDASMEVRSAVVYASIIVVLVFLPVFFLDGLAGTFFRPLALSYILAIGASLLVALTVTPALCLMLLPTKTGRETDPPLVRALKAVYRRILPIFVNRPALAGAIVLSAFGLAGYLGPKLGEQFLPAFKERDFLMHWVEKPGTSIEAMDRITILASKELRAVPGVRNFGSHIGRAEVADEVVGPNFTELWISLDRDVDYDATVAKVQEIVEGYPGLYRDVLTYLKERIKEVLTGASATVVVRIFGEDLDVLRAKALEVSKSIEGVEGVVDLKVEQMVMVPHIQIRMRPEAAAVHGLTAAMLRNAANTYIQGTRAGQVYQEQKVIDVVVTGIPETRTDPSALREILVPTPSGTPVPLGDVADVRVLPTPNIIKHEGASRRIDVTCNVAGDDLGSVARQIEERVGTVKFDRGYHPEFLGEYAARQSSQKRLLTLSLVALAGILVILHVDFRSLRLVALTGLTLPFALVGGIVAAWLSGGILSLGSLVGFVTVLGIAARNGIMLISHYRHLEESEGMAFGVPLVLRGAEERLAPILMTALCAGLALLPLVLAGDVPGHEIEHPLAVVIVGGLATSTILNLFLMPALYAAFGQRKGKVA